ncbi:teichoic acid transport system permease protein [Lachnotalea glycerini]|uniref:Transport permease protein n=2 Tax=Lachnotalea glycerini TaxID=1763509 RepID=A0A318EPH1_9FIRM|nr:ABC transporter permease [Lachnotalea glycerini]PXV87280.1 teichoic acid transport system permease protein [Lachnotalea glycerini]
MSFIESIKDVLGKRKLIMSLAVADFRKRFVGSYFGVAWIFVQPIVTILIYYLIFQQGFGSRPPVDEPYVVWLVPGIVPWFFLSEALNHATNCLCEYSYLVKKVVFKVSVLPMVKIISCMFVHVIFIIIMVILYLFYGRAPSLYWLQVLYYTFCLFVLLIGLSFITSSVTVLFRDMVQIVNIALQFGIWGTPIMWAPSMFKGMDSYVWILKLNPMYYIVDGYRSSFINHTGFWEKPGDTLYFWVFTAIVFVIGLKLFKKLKPHFADVL